MAGNAAIPIESAASSRLASTILAYCLLKLNTPNYYYIRKTVKMSSLHKLSLVLVILCLIDLGQSLKCHQCNSFDHSKCGDPFVYEADRTGAQRKPKTDEYLKDCPAPVEGAKPFTLCRKIYQNVRGDERVIRSCGYEEYKHECYKTVLEEYNTYVCQCKEDGCNSAGTAQLSLFLLSSIVAFWFAK